MFDEFAPAAEPKRLPPVRLTSQRVGHREFDSLVAGFDGVTHELCTAFATARWPGLSVEPIVFLRDDRPVAAAQMIIWQLPLLSYGVAASKWGPALRDEMDPQRDQIYEATVDHLIAEYAGRRRIMLSIMPRAERDVTLRAADRLRNRGFWSGTPFPFPDFYFARVRLSDAEQRRSFSQKWRYHLQKSEQQGLVFEAAGHSDLPRFQALYEAMTERKRFPDFSAYRTLPQFMAHAPEALRPSLFFVTKDGADVAGAVVFTAGRTAAYLYGATNEKALPMRAGYFMQSRILSWLRDNTRAEWYDLGGSDGFHGLHQFKKGLIGQAGLVSAVPPVASIAVRRRPWMIGRTVYALRDWVQFCRKMARGLNTRLAKPDQERAT